VLVSIIEGFGHAEDEHGTAMCLDSWDGCSTSTVNVRMRVRGTTVGKYAARR